MLVGGPRRRPGILLTGQQRGQSDPWRGQAVALKDALDGAVAGDRPDTEPLQLGADGAGPDQAVARRRRGVGPEPAAEREDGPLRFGREPQGDVVVGPGQVVEAVGPGLQLAAQPLTEPDLGAADGGADGLDGPAGEAQGNGAMTSSQFMAHGYLRVAAAGGRPRRYFNTWRRAGRGSSGSRGQARAATGRRDALSVRRAEREAMRCRSATTRAMGAWWVVEQELARFGPTTPTRAGRLADASVDPTEAGFPRGDLGRRLSD